MGRSKATVVENNFINGVVTQATGLNFPENACTSAYDCVFDSTGRVTRRRGFKYEPSYALNSVTRDSGAIVEYTWAAAGGAGDFNFAVQQIGKILHFYYIVNSDSLSNNKHATTIDLATYTAGASAASIAALPASFASGKGYMFVTHPYCEPIYVQFNTSTLAITASSITIQCRDFEGVDDGLAVDNHPATLSTAHKYNLHNQGWSGSKVDGGGSAVNLINSYFTIRANYPSNAEQWWLLKNSSEEFQPAFVDRTEPGNSLAPKGHYILPWFNTDRTSYAGASVAERSAGFLRPRACAFYAGRVFYGGVSSNAYAGEIYFSQIIEDVTQVGKCYQVNDPTSENLSDLLPSDGGIIKVLDMGVVYRIFPTQKALIVFASNGIWAISGSDVAGFKADDYTVRKISSIRIENGLSFVDVLGSPVFWNKDGIWTVGGQNDQYEVQSMSDDKVAKLVKSIPDAAKTYVKGAFDSNEKILQWCYRSTSPATVDEAYTYDRILTLNVKTGAFYVWKWVSAAKKLNGIFPIVYADYTPPSVEQEYRFRYATSVLVSGATYNLTFSLCADMSNKDWAADENLDYLSEVFSGYKVHADANKNFQSNYITFYLEENTGSSAFVQGLWDFNNLSTTKEWTTPQQIYGSSPNHTYRQRRIKMRGSGKALQFHIYSSGSAPFCIVGWSSLESANADV